MFLKQLKEFPSDAIKRTFLSDLTKWQSDGHKADPVQDFEDKVIQLWSQLDKPTSYPSAKKAKEPAEQELLEPCRSQLWRRFQRHQVNGRRQNFRWREEEELER